MLLDARIDDPSQTAFAPYRVPVSATAPEAVQIAARDAWLDGSAFVKDGAPVVLFHGTDVEEPFNVFARYEDMSIGFHFGVREAANARIDEIFRMVPRDENAGVLIPVICRARNPLRLRDHYTWSMDDIANELLDLGLIDEDEKEAIVESCDEHFVFAAIERAGYDCVVYANECEHKAERTDSFLIWRAELLKSPFAATFDRDDPRLLPQNETAAADVAAWLDRQQTMDEAAAVFAPAGPGLA